jgi:hypothetical protein
MKTRFKQIRFSAESRRLIEICDGIISEYTAAGLRLTLRQLYYQLVSANVVPNEEKSYKNVGSLVSNGRLAGLLDWDAIEDRVRQPRRHSEWSSIKDLVEAALYSFRLPRLMGQETYVEVWCEKDALAGVLESITNKYHLVLMVNRGYSSMSAMYESAQRIDANRRRYGSKFSKILYLGDLDPSGEDMVRDIRDRLAMFETEVIVEKVALTIDQVQQYQLPPNPAKLGDSRAAEFLRRYGGSESWELDAIPPKELQRLVTSVVTAQLDLSLLNAVKEREADLCANLREAVEETMTAEEEQTD